MFEKLTHNDLLSLTSVQAGPCISIYIPNLPSKTLAVEYEALVRRAEHLLSFDKRPQIRAELTETLNKFNPAEHFSDRDQGLALFVSKHWKSYFLTAHTLPSKTVVADSFHLKPLLQDIQGTHSYHILAIAAEEAVMLHCDSGKSNEVHTFLFHQGQHSSNIHWKHYDESETVQLPHMNSQSRARGVADSKFKKKSTKLFLKWIEAKISNEPGYKTLPLYLFTSDSLYLSFKEVTHHPHPTLIRTDVTTGIPRTEALVHQGNLQLQKDTVHQKSATIQTMVELARQRKVVDDLLKISKAALGGKIRTLYLRDNIELWGNFRRQSGEVTFHEKQMDSKDDDILDDIACEVIRQGGEVVVLSGKEMPTKSPAAAILNI